MDPETVLEVFGEVYNHQILSAASEPKSVQQLSDELDIPIATVYRRTKGLVEADLLSLQGRPLNGENRRNRVYVRKVQNVTLDFTENDVIDISERTPNKEKLDLAQESATTSESHG